MTLITKLGEILHPGFGARIKIFQLLASATYGTGALFLALADANADPMAEAKNFAIHTVQKGESADLYFQVNLKGRVFINIKARPKESNCANFWWVKWPFGNIQHLGRHCGTASFKIPSGFRDLAFSSKLRTGGTDNQIKIAIAASEAIANSAKFEF